MTGPTRSIYSPPEWQPEPWPAPEVPARRPLSSDEVPKPALSVAKLADVNGWSTRQSYARGTYSAARTTKEGKEIPAQVREMFALLCWRKAHEVIAGIWHRRDGQSWAFDVALTPQLLDGRLNSAEMKARLTA